MAPTMRPVINKVTNQDKSNDRQDNTGPSRYGATDIRELINRKEEDRGGHHAEEVKESVFGSAPVLGIRDFFV